MYGSASLLRAVNRHTPRSPESRVVNGGFDEPLGLDKPFVTHP
jgi:hypothetical protein